MLTVVLVQRLPPGFNRDKKPAGMAVITDKVRATLWFLPRLTRSLS